MPAPPRQGLRPAAGTHARWKTDAQACTEDVETCWGKAVDKMQADVALAKVKAQLWEAKAAQAAKDAVDGVQVAARRLYQK